MNAPIINPDWMGYLRAIFAFTFVIGLIFVSAGLAKRAGLDKRLAGIRGGAARISVVENAYIGPKHRLVLVRCDDREHLLLLGQANDVVIESRNVVTPHA